MNPGGMRAVRGSIIHSESVQSCGVGRSDIGRFLNDSCHLLAERSRTPLDMF